MILSVRINNFMVYSGDAELTLCADDEIKRLDENVASTDGYNVLRSACVFGANNSGKSCLVKAIKCIKDVLLNAPKSFPSNIFSESKAVGLGVSFIQDGRAFSYDFKYDSTLLMPNMARGFVYERLAELNAGEDGSSKDTGKEIFVRDEQNEIYRFIGDAIPEKRMQNLYPGNILIYSVPIDNLAAVEQYADILTAFAENLEIIDSPDVSFKKTVIALMNDTADKDKIVEMIKEAGLGIEDFKYVGFKDKYFPANGRDYSKYGEDYQECLEIAREHFYSVHRGKAVPSLEFDSAETAKMVALAGYIVDALQNGKTLVADELDSGLHFTLTRSLVLLFNNNANEKNAQLIFCTHDMTLLDCEYVFRQDQVWFVCCDEKTEYLYPLSDLGFPEEEVTRDSDLLEKYRHGELSHVPDADFITIFLNGE